MREILECRFGFECSPPTIDVSIPRRFQLLSFAKRCHWTFGCISGVFSRLLTTEDDSRGSSHDTEERSIDWICFWQSCWWSWHIDTVFVLLAERREIEMKMICVRLFAAAVDRYERLNFIAECCLFAKFYSKSWIIRMWSIYRFRKIGLLKK